MASRIQFRTTDDEYSIIEQNAANAGHSSISQFVKELALAYPNNLKNSNLYLSFSEIYDDVKKAVEKTVKEKPNGFPFVLRDIVSSWKTIPQHENGPSGTIPKPLRASVGKHFYSEVKKDSDEEKDNEVKRVKRFPNVRFTSKVDKYGTAIYEVYGKAESEKK